MPGTGGDRFDMHSHPFAIKMVGFIVPQGVLNQDVTRQFAGKSDAVPGLDAMIGLLISESALNRLKSHPWVWKLKDRQPMYFDVAGSDHEHTVGIWHPGK
jgi:hypothetical protein